jgi:hypothetical protein
MCRLACPAWQAAVRPTASCIGRATLRCRRAARARPAIASGAAKGMAAARRAVQEAKWLLLRSLVHRSPEQHRLDRRLEHLRWDRLLRRGRLFRSLRCLLRVQSPRRQVGRGHRLRRTAPLRRLIRLSPSCMANRSPITGPGRRSNRQFALRQLRRRSRISLDPSDMTYLNKGA